MLMNFMIFITIYLAIGFVISSLFARYTSVIYTGTLFMFMMAFYPVIAPIVGLVVLGMKLDIYVYWLNNKIKIDNSFEFAKKVYLLYGEDAATESVNYAYQPEGKMWDEKIKKEYTQLGKDGKIFAFWNHDPKFQVIKNNKFTPYFYKRMGIK